MEKPLVPLRDVYLAPAVALTVALLAQKLGYSSQSWSLALAAILGAMALSAAVGAWLRKKRTAAFNAYSIALAIAALLFVFKWSAKL